MTEEPHTPVSEPELKPGQPLIAETVGLVKRGDWVRPTLSGSTPHQVDRIGGTVRNTPLVHFTDGGSCLASVAVWLGRPDADGWIAHDGGENPAPGMKVDYRWVGPSFPAQNDDPNLQEGGGQLSDRMGWGDITHWRPHVPPQSEKLKRAYDESAPFLKEPTPSVPLSEGEAKRAAIMREVKAYGQSPDVGSALWVNSLTSRIMAVTQ